jgi:LacI family transcriptional regulator
MTTDPINFSRRITLRDIADATGFSVNTVSHALKDKPDISLETRQRIKQKAKEMGYIVDSIAGSMRSGVTRTIAVILGDVLNPHFGNWVREIERTAFMHGYSTLIINTDEDENVELDAITTAISKRVDGIIICPTQKNEDNLALMHKSGIPHVLIGRHCSSFDCDYVVSDDVQGGYIATRYLIDQGHRHILFLNGPSHISSSRERLEGYLTAHKDAGMAADPALIHEVGIRTGECGGVLRQVISEGVTFTAVLAFSDIVALETLSELKNLGKEFSTLPVAGFDNIQAGLILPVPLISVGAAEGSAAVWAVDLLMERMLEKQSRQPSRPTKKITLKVKLYFHD